VKGPLLSGPARDAVVTYLQANLNAALATDDILRDDGINLEPISSDNYFIDENFTPLKWPACFVIIGKMKFNYDRGQNYIDGVHELETVIVIEERTFDRIQKKVESYGRALFKVLDQQQLIGPDERFQLKLVSDEIEYSPTFETKASAGSKYYRKAIVYKWRAMHFEKTLIP